MARALQWNSLSHTHTHTLNTLTHSYRKCALFGVRATFSANLHQSAKSQSPRVTFVQIFLNKKTKNKKQQFVNILNNNKNIFSRHQQHIVHKRFKVLVDIKNSISYVVGDLCLNKNYDD